MDLLSARHDPPTIDVACKISSTPDEASATVRSDSGIPKQRQSLQARPLENPVNRNGRVSPVGFNQSCNPPQPLPRHFCSERVAPLLRGSANRRVISTPRSDSTIARMWRVSAELRFLFDRSPFCDIIKGFQHSIGLPPIELPERCTCVPHMLSGDRHASSR